MTEKEHLLTIVSTTLTAMLIVQRGVSEGTPDGDERQVQESIHMGIITLLTALEAHLKGMEDDVSH